MRKIILPALAALAITAGCAANSGVIDQGDGTFFVSKQAATGFPGLGTLKADVIEQARDYCVGIHRNVEQIKLKESTPPFVLGNYPRAEIQFRCTSQ